MRLMHDSPSFELLDDEFLLDDMYGAVDFDFDLSTVHSGCDLEIFANLSDATNMLQSLIKRYKSV